MKKILKGIGLFTLICFSFFYTEKVSNVVKEVDNLMIILKEKSLEYKLNPIDAKIENGTIIPGIKGKEIDIDKSYQAMKRVGNYNESLLIYKDIIPNQTIEKNYDKYVIGGNNNKKEVSLIILTKEKTNIEYIRMLSNNKNIHFSFFINSDYLENNSDLINTLIKEGHNIGNLTGNYTSSEYIWMDTILKKIIKQKTNYCYLETQNETYLKICALNKNYTIIPSIITNKNITTKIKQNIKNGSIISIDGNEIAIDELTNAVNYILSKGYKIVPLSTLLNEKMS